MKRRNKFNLSRTANLSCSPGELVPLGPPVHVMPGDSHQMATSMLLRVLPLLAPVMHPFDVKIHSWFVPHRIVWDEFEEFITGGPDNDSSIVHPYMYLPATTGFAVGSLADYYGIPPGFSDGDNAERRINALIMRGYAKIYNEFYRDQDLQAELPLSTASGLDTTTNQTLMFANWQKDYFTSARPWEAKGPTVMLPLSGDAPVKIDGTSGELLTMRDGSDNLRTFNIGGTSQVQMTGLTGTALGSAYADLSQVSAATILQLRLAMALQRYAENRARFGSRYPEYLLALGVRPDDARLDRPEYLGGGQQTITFSEVLQTAPTTSGTASPGVGNMRGHGIAALRSNRFRKFFSEHGFIHTFVVVRPRTVYPQGLPRLYSLWTKEDYWQPELEHIGQQAILNKEIYLGGADKSAVWGYQDRYDELRRLESTVHGEFRTTLDFWHAARLFTSRPALNAAFVLSNPTNRIYSVTDPAVDKMYLQVRHSHQARRLLSRTGTSFTY